MTKIGDVVSLKSGGPKMTVTKVDNLVNDTAIVAVFFNEITGALDQGSFRLSWLREEKEDEKDHSSDADNTSSRSRSSTS